MSLLIKALEQAAKERTSPRVEVQSSPALEQSSLAAREPTPNVSFIARSENIPNARSGAASGTRAGAARVLDAWRSNPVFMLAAVAVVFAIGFGIYVYSQVASPGMFARQVTSPAQQTIPQSAELAPPIAAPASLPEQAKPDTPDSAAAAANALVAPQSSPAHAPAEARPAEAAPRNVPAAAPAVRQRDAPAASEAPAARKPIPTSTVVAAAGGHDAVDAAPPSEPRAERTRSRKSAAAPRAAPPAPQPASDAETREQIAVSPASLQSRINPHVSEGYALLQAGNLAAARASYSRVIETEPLNIDALLGLAYIAAQEQRSDEAFRTYVRILQLNPRHAVAQAALIGLMGRADPAASETRLKQLISREPSPFLHFVLGNLYSDQSLWSQAQQSYFQAHHLEPDNPDYAYNLAIGLDHLGQRKLALEFYRRAEQLARHKGRSSFDPSNAEARINSLSSRLP
jgi:tetratricopeptide (TPR) repeat protein